MKITIELDSKDELYELREILVGLKKIHKVGSDTSLVGTGLTFRSINGLASGGIFTLSDLVKKSESDLLKIQRIGRGSVNEIKKWLNECGMSLRDNNGPQTNS